MEWIKRVADRWWAITGIGPMDGATGLVAQVGTDVLVWTSATCQHPEHTRIDGAGHGTVQEAIDKAYGFTVELPAEAWQVTATWQTVQVS